MGDGAMIEAAVVGGGLSGLALAAELTGQGRDVRLYEARRRFGGRIETVEAEGPDGALAIDLGPAWFWPGDQPRIAALIADLGLSDFAQHDEGAALQLTDPEQGVEIWGTEPVHAGARRVSGGLGQVAAGLAARLPAGCAAAGHALVSVADKGDHVLLGFETEAGSVHVAARAVALALPPRLIAEQVRFTPEPPPALRRALEETATWMAVQAKAAMTFPAATWREDGRSGTAFVNHERAVLGEVFDLCAEAPAPAALGGFFALAPHDRAAFAAGLPMLVGNQLAQLFGDAVQGGPLHVRDWAAERYTCAAQDLADPATDRRPAHPILRRGHWGGKLHLAGAETARAHPGHMEGALEAAERVAARLEAPAPALSPADLPGWFDAMAEPAFARYRSALNRRLSRQESDNVARAAAEETMAALFEEALDMVLHLNPCADMGQAAARANVIDPMKPAMRRMLTALIGAIRGYNRASCALRAFPDEHALPAPYLQRILQDASDLGRLFLNEVDALLAARAEAR